MNRRKFLKCAAVSGAASTIVPRHVLGGAGHVAPSEKINFGYIGCGTQGLREMLEMLPMPEVQIVAVCDPVKDGADYVDWSKDGMRAMIAHALGKPDWRRGEPGIPGGREVAREVVEAHAAQQRASGQFKGCAAYADFRELLEKQKDIDAVKIMTPDHLHATIAVAAMKKGKRVVMHKPLANRVSEARLVVETAQDQGRHAFPPRQPGRGRAFGGRLDPGGRDRHAARDPQLVKSAGVAPVRHDPHRHSSGS